MNIGDVASEVHGAVEMEHTPDTVEEIMENLAVITSKLKELSEDADENILRMLHKNKTDSIVNAVKVRFDMMTKLFTESGMSEEVYLEYLIKDLRSLGITLFEDEDGDVKISDIVRVEDLL